MVRNRVRKTDHGLFSDEAMREALRLVDDGLSLRGAATRTGLCYGTLHRYVKRRRESGGTVQMLFPRCGARQTLSNQLEANLEDYIVMSGQKGYFLDATDTRRLAFEVALRHKVKIPDGWFSHKMAGTDWLKAFKDRHPEVRLTKKKRNSRPTFTFGGEVMLLDQLDGLLGGAPELRCIEETSTSEAFWRNASKRSFGDEEEDADDSVPGGAEDDADILMPIVNLEVKNEECDPDPMTDFPRDDIKPGSEFPSDEVKPVREFPNQDVKPVIAFPGDEVKHERDSSGEEVKPVKGDYVLVRSPDDSDLHYVGEVINESDGKGELTLRRLRRCDLYKDNFILGTDAQLTTVHSNDIKRVLPRPVLASLWFGVSFDGLNMC